MPIRFDAGSDRLLRSNPDVGASELYSWMAWFNLAVDQDFYAALYSLNTNDQANNFNLDVTLLLDNGTSLGSYVGEGTDSGFSTPGTSLALHTWYFIAGVREAMNSYKVYLNGVLDTTNTYDCTGRSASFTREEVANNYSSDIFDFNGRVYNFMSYRRVLTPEQIRAQMRQFYPIFSYPYLRLWTPMRDRGFRARHRDMVRGAYWTVGGTLTDEPNPPKAAIRRIQFYWLPFSSGSGPITVAVNQVTETDTAQGITRQKIKAVGQNTETDTPQAVTRSKQLVIAQVTESDVSQAIGPRKIASVLQVAETDAALAITAVKILAIGIASESDEALPVGASSAHVLGQAGETDSALAMLVRKIVTIAAANESDSTQAITVLKVFAVGQAGETDTAQGVTKRKILVPGQVLESDAAQPITSSLSKIVEPGLVSEADEALPVTRKKVMIIAQVAQTDQALSILPQKSIVIGQAGESDGALTISHSKIRVMALALEIDLAQPVNRLVEEFFGLAFLSVRLVETAEMTDAAPWSAVMNDAARETAALEDEPL